MLCFSFLHVDRALWFAIPALVISFFGILVGFFYVYDAFKEYEGEEEPAAKAAVGFAISLIVMCVIALPIFLIQEEKPVSKIAAPVTIAPEPPIQTKGNERTIRNTTSFAGWNSMSNGRTWNLASESDKRDLCRRLSRASTKGNSANFFYDALNTLYTTTDAKTLDLSLDSATRMIEAASGTFPESSRNY